MRCLPSSEADLHLAIAQVLTSAGVRFEREVVLSRKDRIDFLADPDVGIEAKIDGSRSSLLRQIDRYAALDRIGAIVVVTNRARLLDMPTTLRGKPVHAISLLGSGL